MDDSQWTFSHWFLFESSSDEGEAGSDGGHATDEADDPADRG